jgi:hypothetical protein
VYSLLLGQLAEQVAEIELCRSRLADVMMGLAVDEPEQPVDNLLLPPGCANVAGAADQLVAGDDVLREYDRQTQQHFVDTVGGLARACLTGEHLPATFGPALVELAESQLGPRLTDRAAELFSARHPDPVVALKAMWESAAPVFMPTAETTAVFAPPALADAARAAFGPDVSFTPTTDEIAVVRSSRLPLIALPQFGPAAKAAYQRRKAAGDSPHSRVDMMFSAD